MAAVLPAGAGDVAAGGPTPHKKAPIEFTRVDKVKYLVNLLQKKGDAAVLEIKRRISTSKPLVAKGIVFDASVMQESLGIHASRASASASGGGQTGNSVLGDGAAEGVKRPRTADANDNATGEASRLAKAPRTDHREAFERESLPRHAPSGPSTIPDVKLDEASLMSLRKVIDSKSHPAASSTTPPPLLRMRRAGSLDGPARTTSTPCRSPRGSPRVSEGSASPGVPDPTPPSLGRASRPSAATQSPQFRKSDRLPIPKAAAVPRSLRPASLYGETEDGFGRAVSSSRRSSWEEISAQSQPTSSMASLRRAAQLGHFGGLSPTSRTGKRSHVTCEPSPEPSPSVASRSKPRPRIEAATKIAFGEDFWRDAPSKAPRSNLSVRELKDHLASNGIDFSNCVEKSELQDLWAKFETLCQRPLQELQAAVAAASICNGGGSSPLPETRAACAAQILGTVPPPNGGAQDMPARSPAPRPNVASPANHASPSLASRLRQAPAAPAPAVHQPPTRTPATASRTQENDSQPSPGGAVSVSSEREKEAAIEVKRIDSLRRSSYGSVSDWGFAVLKAQSRDLQAVNKGYRGLMMKLHPDKVQISVSVSRALDAIKEAKDACEKCLSRQYAPGVPRKVSFTALCTTPGKRRYRLHWTAPQENDFAAVKRYIVAAFDPGYGKALNIAVLEPDYDEELRRFVPVEELKEYVLAEEELQKMPSVWRAQCATMQVAAANDAGQSSWATVQIPLSAAMPTALKSSPATPGSIFNSSDAREDERLFAEDVRRRSGEELRIWLERQRKPQIVAFLKSADRPAEGNKGCLVDQVILMMERERLRRRL